MRNHPFSHSDEYEDDFEQNYYASLEEEQEELNAEEEFFACFEEMEESEYEEEADTISVVRVEDKFFIFFGNQETNSFIRRNYKTITQDTPFQLLYEI